MAMIVNLFAGPGAGKSTTAAGVFAELKMAGINCELVREYAKRKVWEKNDTVFENQAYIFGKQSYETLYTARGVDVIVTDSPILLSVLYNSDPTLGEDFNKTVVNTFNSYSNMNYYLERVKEYNPAGRFQNEEQARQKDTETLNILSRYNIPFRIATGDRQGIYDITNDVLKRFDKPTLEYLTNHNAETHECVGFSVYYGGLVSLDGG